MAVVFRVVRAVARVSGGGVVGDRSRDRVDGLVSVKGRLNACALIMRRLAVSGVGVRRVGTGAVLDGRG